jgi:hypothetical protein
MNDFKFVDKWGEMLFLSQADACNKEDEADLNQRSRIFRQAARYQANEFLSA